MTEEQLTDMAREMYTTYREAISGDVVTNLMNRWDELSDPVQAAWVAAATTAYHLSRGTE